MIRRIRLLGLVLFLVACGASAQSLQPGNVAPSIVAVAMVTTATPVASPTPTSRPPTPTSRPPTPSATVVPPTRTVLPSATLTATVQPSPTVVPTPRPTSAPVRLQIPAIGLDAAPISVGLDDQRIPIVPKHLVGWYNLSAMPGQGDNVVFWGHVLRWLDSPNIPAPFARMKELGIGAKVMVTTADGNMRQYRVTKQIEVRPSDVQYILPLGSERVTLVSCIGDTVITNGELTKTKRLLTIAEPAS